MKPQLPRSQLLRPAQVLLRMSRRGDGRRRSALHPLHIGTTGQPKGVVHVHGGYMVGTTYHLELSLMSVRAIFSGALRTSAGSSATATSSMLRSAPVSPRFSAKAPSTGPIPEPRGKSSSAMASPRCSPRPRRSACSCVTEKHLPAAHDLTTLRVIACAGEPLNPEAWHWAQTYLAGDGKWGYVIDNWWQTELGGPTLGTPVTMPIAPAKLASPLPGCRSRCCRRRRQARSARC